MLIFHWGDNYVLCNYMFIGIGRPAGFDVQVLNPSVASTKDIHKSIVLSHE